VCMLGGRQCLLRVPSLIRGIGHVDDIVGLKLTGELAQHGDTVVTTLARAQQLLARDGNILHNALIAIVGQRRQVDFGLTIALIELYNFMVTVPNTANPAPNKHQITLFRSNGQRIPVYQIQPVGGIDEDIPGVDVAVTQAALKRLVDKQAGELFRACDDMVNDGVLGPEQTCEVCCNGVINDVISHLP
jgi:hypothetical protein